MKKNTEKVYGHPRFYELLDEMKDVHSRKNHDYAAEDPLSNLKACERAGVEAWKGVVVRLQDKMSRLENFARKGTLLIKDESIKDTLTDMAVYAVLCRILYEDRNNKS